MTLESVLEGPCIFSLGFGFDSHSILCSYTQMRTTLAFYGSYQGQLNYNAQVRVFVSQSLNGNTVEYDCKHNGRQHNEIILHSH